MEPSAGGGGFFRRPIAGAPRTPGAGRIGGSFQLGAPLSREGAIDAFVQIPILAFVPRGATDPLVQLIGMIGTVALVIPPMRIGQHLLAYPLATTLGLDAVQHRPQFLPSVEHLADAVAFLVPVFEPHQPAGVVGAELPVPLERKLAHLASEHHHANGLAVGVDGSRQ